MPTIFHRIIPHFFTKEPIPSITNPSLQTAINTVKNAGSPDGASQKALNILADRYEATRFKTYLLWYEWLETDPNKLWQRTGFMHCTQLNFLYRVLMVKSGHLRDDQIHLHYSLVYYVSPHQYLTIDVGSDQVTVDPWAYDRYGVANAHMSGFGVK